MSWAFLERRHLVVIVYFRCHYKRDNTSENKKKTMCCSNRSEFHARKWKRSGLVIDTTYNKQYRSQLIDNLCPSHIRSLKRKLGIHGNIKGKFIQKKMVHNILSYNKGLVRSIDSFIFSCYYPVQSTKSISEFQIT